MLGDIGTLAAVALVFSGCGSNTTPPPSTQAQAQLYVAVPFSSPSGTGAIVRFDDPSTLSGNVSPTAAITGDLTRLQSVANLAFDANSDRLFALISTGATGAAILVFDHISTKSGNLAPDRVIEGALTNLLGIGPMVLDPVRDILYAEAGEDASGHVEILTFAGASTLNGNVSPANVLQVAAPGIAATDMVLDAANNRLFLLMNNQSVNVFDNASTLTSGLMTPARIIAGPDTGFTGAVTHIALDPSGRLLVGSLISAPASNSILIFANAATANGDVAPIAAISGSATGLNVGGPGAMAVVTGPNASPGGDLYVNVELGTVLVFKNINTANGNIAPDHSFSVPSLGSGDLEFAVDLTH
jgi:hypothetical protein